MCHCVCPGEGEDEPHEGSSESFQVKSTEYNRLQYRSLDVLGLMLKAGSSLIFISTAFLLLLTLATICIDVVNVFESYIFNICHYLMSDTEKKRSGSVLFLFVLLSGRVCLSIDFISFISFLFYEFIFLRGFTINLDRLSLFRKWKCF